ncbi:MAG: hypothetical protein ACREJG_02990 [Candidatus Rokuibacteriota bacterium]
MVLLLGTCDVDGDDDSDAKWGPFRGRVVDFDGGTPIPGAIAVAVWLRNVLLGPSHVFDDAVVAVTDANGHFEIARRRLPWWSAPIDMPRFPPLPWSYYLDPAPGVAEGEIDPDGTRRVTATLRAGQRHAHTFTAPGIYTPSLRYTDLDGRLRTQRTLVVVYDPAWLEPILNTEWRAFRSAVISGNLAAARDRVHGAKRRQFSLYWSVFGSAMSIDRGPLILERVGGVAALCRTPGTTRRVKFEPDPRDGRWRYVPDT